MGTSGLSLLATLALTLAQDPNPGTTWEYSTQRSFSTVNRPNEIGFQPLPDRAFFGAPPPVPHTIMSDRLGQSCLQCHAREDRIEKRHQAIAPVPHAEFSQCLQCHVPGYNPSVAPFRENTFVGLALPGKGSRAHNYSPPTVPHKTFMRDNCLACHGPTGDFAILSPHPIRSQCQQCHAPEAAADYTRPSQ
jgi:cytochrome c-type protein NapB